MAVRGSLLGASQAISTCAIVPEANSRLMNATSGVPGTMQSRLRAARRAGGFPGQYPRSGERAGARRPRALRERARRPRREVCGRGWPRAAPVGLVQAEIQAARRDELGVTELVGLDQLPDHR